MRNCITNKAVIEVSVCGGIHKVESNSVKVEIRPSVTVCLQAKKIVCGNCLCNKRLTFTVFDSCGNAVVCASNDKNGNIVFPALKFNCPGVYRYTICETSNPGRDTNCYPVIVKVTECGANNLVATVCYPQGLPVFVNKYVPCHCRCDEKCETRADQG